MSEIPAFDADTNTSIVADIPEAAEVFAAAQRLTGIIHRTPLMTSRAINAAAGAEIFFKCEHLQKVGAFKARGAANAVALLPAGTALVATHSSGNHGAALAWAAAERGMKCTVVMPDNAPLAKREAVAAYGAEIIYCAPTLEARESTLADVVARTGAHVVPPFDDRRIIAGQGTVAQEIIGQCREQCFTPDLVVAPVGGGGLLAGVGLAISALAPEVKVLGAEPAGADDAQRSFRSGQRVTEQSPDTMADGLRTTLGLRNFVLIRRTINDVVTVSEADILAAMKLIWRRTKQLVEPSAAVSLAAVLAHPARFKNKRVVLVLTGGNMDLATVGDLMR
ncbi:threonine/serine dehydratase [Microbulbifer sp. CAU 1566]|uniref:threonine ammonia-lyase n=1 Tax=Microbulbifer sp. CAU 1566 TaxID=2933269 RepID=UPI0020042C03|nr:threonine/serine dehydratase [Microbulbifer sp. CAU 1566]MCK7599170.1 threonine/serine dehydratase [Microbulbifer sp. CAU 1566]